MKSRNRQKRRYEYYHVRVLTYRVRLGLVLLRLCVMLALEHLCVSIVLLRWLCIRKVVVVELVSKCLKHFYDRIVQIIINVSIIVR